jgi:hypothetical protein
MMILGSKVQLKSFNGTLSSAEDCDPGENYWLLIGETGVVVDTINQRNRLLIQFNTSVQKLGLYCHNRVENSLYILQDDLVLVDTE